MGMGMPASGSGGSGPGGRQVYVVHSDGGNNVHITLPEGGASVVELPPNYQNTGAGSSSSTGQQAGGAGSPRDEKSRFNFQS